MRERVFEHFFALRGREGTAGVGLGLTLVSKYREQPQGQVQIACHDGWRLVLQRYVATVPSAATLAPVAG